MVPWWDVVASKVQTELVRALRKFKPNNFSANTRKCNFQRFLVRSKSLKTACVLMVMVVPFETELKSSILHILGWKGSSCQQWKLTVKHCDKKPQALELTRTHWHASCSSHEEFSPETSRQTSNINCSKAERSARPLFFSWECLPNSACTRLHF